MTTAASPPYAFFTDLARIINSGQSRSLLLSGNIHDLFHAKGNSADGGYVPLVTFLTEKCQVRGHILLVYELNGPIRLANPADKARLRSGWVAWKLAADMEQLPLLAAGDKSRLREQEMLENAFDANLMEAIGNPTMALEFLRQLTLCSRDSGPGGRPYLAENLLMIIEAADMLLPAGNGDISNLNVADRRRVAIVQDWFSDPGFMVGDDSVVMIAESASLVHPRVTRLPSVLTLEVPSPDEAAREHYINWFMQAGRPALGSHLQPPKLWGSSRELAAFTAGLSVHALRQLLIGAAHSGETLQPPTVIAKVEEFIASQLGEDVVEFKKPSHSLDDVVGFKQLKEFIHKELIPRFRSSGPDALSGAAVAGPIGGGKTFIFEAAASSLGLPVLVLKNIRSQWFGQTDVIFERLRRTLEALGKVIIVVDEADTQFGGVGAGAHETERRLTGKIQQMMSDPALRGRVIWLLMTARIHLLSPDIRRPGRVGDLIIPVLDPEGQDRLEFLRWVLKGVAAGPIDDAALARLDGLTPGYSAAAFASLRSHLKAKAIAGPLSLDAIAEIVRDHIPPAIELARRYQTLQALVNCTRRSLLPNPTVSDEQREAWSLELRALELRGVQ
ncbi:MAG: AAA family ATPase [Pirellulales bacterium]